MTSIRKYFNFMSIALIVLGAFSCGEDDEIADDLSFNIQLMSTTEFGDVLVNQNNQAMYFFASDLGTESSCKGGCADAWPPIIAELGDLDLDRELDLEYFGTITREDGESQITYKGWPLYYFSPDADGELEAAGEITGDGLGNAFFVAKPDYTVMLGNKVLADGEDAATFLVNSWGVTLYYFANDEENVSNCTGGCAETWPILSAPDVVVVPSALSADKFANVERTDDLGTQLAYNGKPLYYFASDDNVRGNTLGHGVNDVWFVLQPAL